MSTPSIEHKNIEKIYVDMQQRAQHQGIMHTDTKNEQKQSTGNKQGGHMSDSSCQKNQTTHDEEKIYCVFQHKNAKKKFSVQQRARKLSFMHPFSTQITNANMHGQLKPQNGKTNT